MIKVKMPFNQIQVNYVEPCKVKKGVFKLADYGLQQDAATLKISSEGSRKAMEYVNIVAVEEGKELLGEEHKAEKSFERLLDDVLNGEVLSKEEQERLDGELIGRIQRHYDAMSNLRLADDDERVLEEMKKNFLMRQQALKDMKQVAEDEKQQEEATRQEAEAAQNADEVANKAAEADMIAKSLEGLDQETDMGAQKNEEVSRGNMSDTAGDNTVSDTDKAANHQKVLNYDENNKGNIEELDNQRIAEAMQEKEYSRMLDESYERTMQVFENKEFSLKERAEAYRIFMDEAEEIAVNREIARHQKIYDYESVIDLRLKTLSSCGMKNTTAQTDKDTRQSTGQDFVKDAAADKLKAAPSP
ncbi:MAG: hypothetical protein K2G55_03245 [Lachnospiraceae bacterium]|nr:hypothetical protein [Lachnospiraceae bacterium]MDE7202953.1 hypothetical protein [Lachnospiraceae bacterium]